MFWHHSREGRTGVRAWWHFGADRRCISVEFYWWHTRCHASIGCDDEGWNIAAGLFPFALYVNLEGFGLWVPRKKCIATWDNNREFWITDRRECHFSISDWTIRFTPWGKWGEYDSRDPWWIRGVHLDLTRLVLGKQHYKKVVVTAAQPIQIPMPEGSYAALATIERATWRRQRWFPHSRTYVEVEIPKGIPFAGKGENSWDCDDDGLFGYSVQGTSLEHAIAHGVESVLKSRRRYGKPSDESIQQALKG